MKETILTGIRSNEEPTIGNFFGAFLPMVELQKSKADDYRIHMFVPDLHSFTTPVDHDSLYASTLRNLKYYIAADLDIDNSNTFIYRQSFIPAHSEMTWILDCFTHVGEMQRMIQFKDKSSEHPESVTMGLMNYPVLMAADILLYNARWVPVGEDQFQHLEITRDIAERMNNKFGDLFTLPENTATQTRFLNRDKGLRIRSLTEPTKKMSKSAADKRSAILLSDSPEDAAKKIMSAATDSLGEIHFDWKNQPGVTNLLQLLALTSGRDQDHVNADWEGKPLYGDLKKAVAQALQDFLSKFQARYLSVDESRLLEKLIADEASVSIIANETLSRVQKAVGLRPRD